MPRGVSPCSALDPRRQQIVLNLLGDAEIGDLDSSLVVNEDVSALDITMDDITLVEVVETSQGLLDPPLNECFFKGAVFVQEGGNGSSWNVFQENIQEFVVRTRTYPVNCILL